MWKRIMLAAALFILPPILPALAEEEPPDLQLPLLSAHILMEAGTGQILSEKAASDPFPVAGLSKLPAILTLAQAFDDGSIDHAAEVLISARAAETPGPTAFLEADERIAAAELIKAAVMISAGDAVMALTEHAYGAESVMLDNMAVTMQQAGLSTRLSSVLGTDELMNAKDLAALGAKAKRSGTFLRNACLYLDSITHSDGRETELVNANRLLRFFPGAAGLLTGSSQTAGYSGVFYTSRSNTNLIAVVIGAANNADRFDAAEKLFTYGFQNYTAKTLVKAGGIMAPSVTVRGGTAKTVNLVAKEEVAVLLKKNADKLTEVRDIPEYLEPPVGTEEPVGSVTYKNEAGEEAAVIPLYADIAVEPFGILDILRRIAKSFVA